MPRAMVVDDEEDMRVLVRATIRQADGGLAVACEAGDGEEAIRVWRSCQPDVIVLDERMPRLTGMEAAARILAERPEQAIVLFTAFLTETVRRTAESIGIRACLSKDAINDLPATLWSLLAA